ncbi:MAG: hypothetical protein HYV07_12550 [Deltaproteobacteria bacterium]|nr:hypothetical protein [Deltaproteobacteria bacterium]
MADRFEAYARVVLACLVVFVACFALQSLTAPIVREQHNWRQADTYSVAYSFHRDGLDVLHPRIDLWRGPSGIVGMEAPVHPLLTHLLMFVVGEHPRAGRIVSFVSLIFALCLTIRWLWPESARKKTQVVCFLTAISLSPLALCEFRQVQPDGLSVALTLGAAAFFRRFAKTGRRRNYVAGLLVYSIAVVTKSPVVSAGPALFLLSWVGAAERPSISAILTRGAGFLIPLAAGASWYFWANGLTERYEVLGTYVSYRTTGAEILRNLRSSSSARQVLGFLLGTYALNWVLAPAAIAGGLLGLKVENRSLGVPMWVWLVGSVAFCFPFADRTQVHWYYAAILLPPAAYFAALGLANLITPDEGRGSGWAMIFVFLCFLIGPFMADPASGRSAPAADGPAFETTWAQSRGLGAVAEAAVVAFFIARIDELRATFRRRSFRAAVALVALVALTRGVRDGLEAFRFRTGSAEWAEFEVRTRGLREAVDRVSSRDDLFVVDGANPWYLHLLRRRGLTADPSTNLAESACRTDVGLTYYVHFKDNSPLPEAIRGAALLASSDEFAFYRLVPKLEGDCVINSEDLPLLADLSPNVGEVSLGRAISVENVQTKKCLGALPREGSELEQLDCDPKDRRLDFKTAPGADGLILYKDGTRGEHYCAAPAAGSGTKVRLIPCDLTGSSSLQALRARNGTVFIRVPGSDLVWDMPPTDANGLTVQQFVFHAGPNQQWRIKLRPV